MATVTARRGHRSLIGMVISAVQARSRAKGKPSKLTALAVVAREQVAPFASLAAADFGAFHFGAGAGWIAVGVSITLLDWSVTGK